MRPTLIARGRLIHLARIAFLVARLESDVFAWIGARLHARLVSLPALCLGVALLRLSATQPGSRVRVSFWVPPLLILGGAFSGGLLLSSALCGAAWQVCLILEALFGAWRRAWPSMYGTASQADLLNAPRRWIPAAACFALSLALHRSAGPAVAFLWTMLSPGKGSHSSNDALCCRRLTVWLLQTTIPALDLATWALSSNRRVAAPSILALALGLISAVTCLSSNSSPMRPHLCTGLFVATAALLQQQSVWVWPILAQSAVDALSIIWAHWGRRQLPHAPGSTKLPLARTRVALARAWKSVTKEKAAW